MKEPSFFGSGIKSNNYEGVNPVNGNEQHPNRYTLLEKKALLEKRNEYINQAIGTVLKKQKDDVLKRPAVGFITLVERELEKEFGLDKQIGVGEKAVEEFGSEFSRDVVRIQVCNYFHVSDADFVALDEKIKEYYQ